MFFIFLSHTACVSDVDFEIEGANSRIFIYSEFEPGADMALKYSTAVGLNDLIPEINPTLTTDFEYNLQEDGEDFETSFRYDPVLKLFISPKTAQVVKEGVFYTVKSKLTSHPDLPAVHAQTYVPFAKPLTSLEEVEDTSTEDEQYFINKKLKLTTDVNHTYFELEAYINNPSAIGGIQKLDINLPSRTKGVLELANRKSLLIDSKKLNNQYIIADVTGGVDLDVKDSSQGVLLKLKTVNEDHYKYHKTLAKEMESLYAPLSEPVINYSNVVNGIGLFTAYSSTVDTLAF